MARNRSIMSQKRAQKKSVIDIDITSLLDILVILLVFLLRSYNSSGITVNVPSDIELPLSVSQNLNQPGILIQVSKDEIWVESNSIIKGVDMKNKNFDQNGKRIIPLFNELVKKKKEIEQLSKRALDAKDFSGVANLVVDKSIKYSLLQQIMYTAASAGFQEFKFVVMGEE
jgi:biopolymer transport protein ExbD